MKPPEPDLMEHKWSKTKFSLKMKGPKPNWTQPESYPTDFLLLLGKCEQFYQSKPLKFMEKILKILLSKTCSTGDTSCLGRADATRYRPTPPLPDAILPS